MPTLIEPDQLDAQVLIDKVTDSRSSTPAFGTREWPALVRKGMPRCWRQPVLRQPWTVAGDPRLSRRA
jgi:hypothetical protein